MSSNLKSPDMLKDVECEKGQLSQRPPIPYVPVVDLVTPKEDPAVLKVKSYLLPWEQRGIHCAHSCGPQDH